MVNPDFQVIVSFRHNDVELTAVDFLTMDQVIYTEEEAAEFTITDNIVGYSKVFKSAFILSLTMKTKDNA